jgi:uncharacterized protein (TIGR03437 family)
MFNVIGLNGNTGATLPLSASLAGVSIAVKDSAGAQRAALLYGAFASAEQVNFVVPPSTAPGAATVLAAVPSGPNQSTQITIGNVAPGIFTVNQNGQGTFAGQIVYVNPNGSQSVVESAALSGSTFCRHAHQSLIRSRRCVPAAIRNRPPARHDPHRRRQRDQCV